jgi:hypothetical protein
MGTASSSAKEEAKECVKNALFGLIIAVGSWVLLNTINPTLVSTDLNPASSSASMPVTPPGATVAPPPTKPGWYFQYKDVSGNTVNTEPTTSVACATAHEEMLRRWNDASIPMPKPQPLTGCNEIREIAASAGENAVRASLAGFNVFVNKGACPNLLTRMQDVPGGCTSVEGLQAGAVSAIQSLTAAVGGNPPSCTATAAARKDPSCKVVVSGGTELGHARAGGDSHNTAKDGGTGNTFDIRKGNNSDAVTSYLTSSATKMAPSFSGYKRYLAFGWWWTNESDHWHACKDGGTNWFCRSDLGAPGLPLKCDTSLTPNDCKPCDPKTTVKPATCP